MTRLEAIRRRSTQSSTAPARLKHDRYDINWLLARLEELAKELRYQLGESIRYQRCVNANRLRNALANLEEEEAK